MYQSRCTTQRDNHFSFLISKVSKHSNVVRSATIIDDDSKQFGTHLAHQSSKKYRLDVWCDNENGFGGPAFTAFK